MGSLDDLLKKLWDDYAAINKQADGIYNLLTSKGETVVNDHVAFRTFNLPKVGVDALAAPFLKFGYEPKGEHQFEAKKLHAKHFEHPDDKYPLVFISELKTEEFADSLQTVAKDLVAQVPDDKTKEWDFCVSGRLWKPVTFETYKALKAESEYAAWLAVFGFRANHFTVLFNALNNFKELSDLNDFLKENGFALNSSGGEVKGTPKELLEQSSTMAHPVEVKFADGKQTVPACYYEFARRYPLPDGKLFTGFIAKSADKIFESTDNK